MNSVPIQTTAPEASSVKWQRTSKAETAGSGFRDMLAETLQANDSGKTGKTVDGKPEKAAATNGKARRPQSQPEDAGETPEVAAMNAMAQAAQPVEEVQQSGEAGEDQMLMAVQPVSITPITESQVTQTVPELPEQSAEEETLPVQEQQSNPVQTRERQPNPMQAREIAGNQTRTRGQSVDSETRTADMTGTEQETRQTAAAAVIPEEAAADVVSAKIVTQSPEVVPAERARPIVRQTNVEDPRFGEMLTRASRELTRGRGVSETTETAEGPEITEIDLTQEKPQVEAAVDPELGTETEIDTGIEPKAEIEAEPEIETETRQEPRAAAVKETAPRFEQRPLKEMPKTDEAVLGLVQSKPDMNVPEIELRQPVAEAQPVRIPDQAEQIHARVIESLENDRLEFQMQLQPKELGRVDVKLVLESGKLAMEIAAASSKSTELLTKQVDSLVASLRLSGVEISSVNVVTARENADGNMNSPYSPENFQNQPGGQNTPGRHASNGGTGREATDYSESRTGEDRTAPQRLLNYSV